MKYLAIKNFTLPRGAVQLTLDLDEPKTNELLVKNQIQPEVQIGYEQTVDVYEFNKNGEICTHTREVRILDTELQCEISDQIKVTKSESHLVIPLLKKHVYLNPQFTRLEFVFFDLYTLELENFSLKINTQKDIEWCYDLCEKIKDRHLTYLYFLTGF